MHRPIAVVPSACHLFLQSHTASEYHHVVSLNKDTTQYRPLPKIKEFRQQQIKSLKRYYFHENNWDRATESHTAAELYKDPAVTKLPLTVLEQEGGGTIPHLRPGLPKDTGWMKPISCSKQTQTWIWTMSYSAKCVFIPVSHRIEGLKSCPAMLSQSCIQKHCSNIAMCMHIHTSTNCSLSSLELCLCAWLHMHVWPCVCGTQELAENRLCRCSVVQSHSTQRHFSRQLPWQHLGHLLEVP